MVLLRVQPVLRDEQREVSVLDPGLFDLRIEPGLDRLPDGERPGAQDVAAADVVVRNHLRGEQGLGVPVREVGALGRGEAELGFLLLVGGGGGARAGCVFVSFFVEVWKAGQQVEVEEVVFFFP